MAVAHCGVNANREIAAVTQRQAGVIQSLMDAAHSLLAIEQSLADEARSLTEVLQTLAGITQSPASVTDWRISRQIDARESRVVRRRRVSKGNFNQENPGR